LIAKFGERRFPTSNIVASNLRVKALRVKAFSQSVQIYVTVVSENRRRSRI